MKLRIILAIAVLLFTGLAMADGQWGVIDTTPQRPGAVTPTARETLIDPTGDTFGSGTPQHDIIEFRGERVGTDLIITLTFDGPISPANTGNPEDLYGFIDVDSDQNPGTGVIGGTAGFCGGAPALGQGGGGLGVDYVIDIFDYDAKSGQVPVIPGDIGTRGGGGFADAVFSTNSVTITVAFSVLETVDGIVDMATVIGTQPEPTDCAPDSGALTVPVEVQSFSVD